MLIALFCIRLTLGGGYGYLTGEHGLALDNLVEVQFLLNLSYTFD